MKGVKTVMTDTIVSFFCQSSDTGAQFVWDYCLFEAVCAL